MSIKLRAKLMSWSRVHATWVHVGGVGLALSLALLSARASLVEQTDILDRDLARTSTALTAAENAIEDAIQLNRLKARDIKALRSVLSTEALARKTYTEQRFALAEEKRQLEKQWDLLTIYLMFDPNEGKLHIMRGDQALRTFPAGPVTCSSGTFKLDKIYAVSSKERFPHPERGKVEFVEGQLKWIPPQQSADRSAALGEHVLFTNGPLILHAPSKDPTQHDAYPHCCMGIGAPAAGRIYSEVFVGSKLQSLPQRGSKAVDGDGNTAYN